MLAIEGRAKPDRDQAELILGGVQRPRTHGQQAAQLAATEQALGDGDGRAALGDDVHHVAGRVGGRRLRLKLGRHGPHHQRLAVAGHLPSNAELRGRIMWPRLKAAPAHGRDIGFVF
ncbi:MAG: hypothetical protein LCH90_15525, partial [Proteobacteria bacterium]|nr:hypothetical protein [Pseudomonadota bacterium]